MVLQAAVVREVVGLVAPPNKLHKVAMPETTDDGHLRDVLPSPLS
jgi:hypothetical protein